MKKMATCLAARPYAHLEPAGRRGGLQVPAQVRQLLELSGQHGQFGDVRVTDAGGTARAAAAEESVTVAAARGLAPDQLALADETRRELRGPAVLAPRAAQDQCGRTVLDERLSLGAAVGARDLRQGLHPQYATAAKLAQPCQGVLEAVDGAERIELVDDEPQPLVVLRLLHRLEDCQPYPRCEDRAQRRDL